MPSNRCSICALDWPRRDDFKKCPHCEEATTPFSNVDAMPDAEASRLKNFADFEREYGPAAVS